MQIQYTKILNNKGVFGIIRRFCNYIDPRLTEHGSHVAYIISRMLQDTGKYSKHELRDICFLAQLHDIGAYKTEEISRMLQFETDDIWDHSFYGYLFIRYFSPLKELAPAVLLHHITWNFLEQGDEPSTKLKDLSQILHIADRIDVSMSLEKRSWEETLQLITQRTNNVFAPQIIDLAAKLNFKDSIENEWRKDSKYFDFLTSIPLSEEETTEYLNALRHHEKLNGTGYPKKLKAEDLSTEERLVAIADIISALTGARSYKASFPTDDILAILTRMKNDGLLDESIVDLAAEHLYDILDTTSLRCQPILNIYEKLRKEYETLPQFESYDEKLHFALTLRDPELMPSWP